MTTASPSPVRVVLVEDHADTRKALESALRPFSARIEVTAAVGDGQACLRLLETATFDAALVDLRLPGMSGSELIRSLSHHAPRMRCVALTVFDDEKTVLEALRAGAHGYLLKSEPTERLVLAIEEATTGAHPISSRVAGFLFTRASREPSAADLSDREAELASLLADGLTYAECSTRMGIGLGTVQDYVKRLYRKLDINSRTEVRQWVEQYLRKRPT